MGCRRELKPLMIVACCYFCGSDKNIEKHSLDGNHNNNDPNNKVKLCKICHVWVHKYIGVSDKKEFENLKTMGQATWGVPPSKPGNLELFK